MKIKVRDLITSASIGASSALTEITKGITFAANSVSRSMDVANGGYVAHGGFHRLFGGHSLVDTVMWKQFGMNYPVELGKDLLTPNGLPLPGIETAVRNNWVSNVTAQKWATFNVGSLLATGISVLDTGLNTKRFLSHRDTFDKQVTSVALKGAIKVAVGASHGNAPLIGMGAVDLGLSAYSKIESKLEFEMEEIGLPDFHFSN